jgi:hypothetical protein
MGVADRVVLNAARLVCIACQLLVVRPGSTCAWRHTIPATEFYVDDSVPVVLQNDRMYRTLCKQELLSRHAAAKTTSVYICMSHNTILSQGPRFHFFSNGPNISIPVTRHIRQGTTLHSTKNFRHKGGTASAVAVSCCAQQWRAQPAAATLQVREQCSQAVQRIAPAE